jgi:hypothetical protein
LRNGSKCSHTTCMLRFFTVSRLALNPNLILEIGSIVHSEMALFVLLGVLSPRRRLYPPACKPYGLEAEPEAAGFRLRRTDVRLTANPCAALIRTKIAHFCIGHPLCSFLIHGWTLTKVYWPFLYHQNRRPLIKKYIPTPIISIEPIL